MLQGMSYSAGKSKGSRRLTILLSRSFGDPRVAKWPSDKLTVWTKPKVGVLICNIFMISQSSHQRIAALDAPKRGQDFVCLVWIAKLQSCWPYIAVNRDGTSLPFIVSNCSPTVDGRLLLRPHLHVNVQRKTKSGSLLVVLLFLEASPSLIGRRFFERRKS